MPGGCPNPLILRLDISGIWTGISAVSKCCMFDLSTPRDSNALSSGHSPPCKTVRPAIVKGELVHATPLPSSLSGIHVFPSSLETARSGPPPALVKSSPSSANNCPAAIG